MGSARSDSVSSNVNQLGSAAVARRICDTDVTRSRFVTSIVETLMEKRSGFARRWLISEAKDETWCRAQWPISRISPVSSASPMKVAGPCNPNKLWSQRSKASAPTTAPVRRSILGW